MREYLPLGSTPTGESCAQIGSRDYAKRARRECQQYIDQLIRQFGEPPAGVNFMTKTFPHDFGSYYEVVIWYTVGDPIQESYAFSVEGSLPESWDGISPARKKEMESKGIKTAGMTVGSLLEDMEKRKAKPKEVKWLGDPGVCDICHESFNGEFVDGRTRIGPWAKMCTSCYKDYGVGLGTGCGQRYKEQPDARWLKVEG